MIVTSTLVPPLWPSRMSLDIVYCPLGRWGEVNKPLTIFCSIPVGFYVLLSTLCAMKFLIVYLSNQFSSIQLLSHVRLFVTAWTAARQASLSITNTQSLLKPMPIELVMPSNHLILCRPLLLLAPIPARIRVFSNESALRMRWPKYWSFSFSISPSNNTQYVSPSGWTGWISLQCKGLSRVFSNTTVQKHQFFGAQLSSQSNSHIHTWPTGKTIALTRWTFVGKVMSLLFNMLSRFVITFLPRSKHLLISWLQSPSAVILQPP